ncbi:MAG: HAD-IC family P-type ATPase [Rhodospirillales bacterium]|nr:HAD-IC family P-type ATPase [Rhodospirillales bacterium]
MDATPDIPANAGRPWHALDPAATLDALGVGREGLGSAEAERRLARFGRNALPRHGGPNLALIFIRQFKSPLIYLLLAAALVSVIIGEARDALFIGGVLLVNASIGTSQEWQAARGAAALDALVVQQAVVWRDGWRHSVDSAALVPGDIVDLESGQRVPADLRLLRAHELRVDESLLTGESLPVEKQVEAVLPDTASLGDRVTMLHAGTAVLAGRATGVVALTGSETQLGRIAGALAEPEAAPPPLILRLELFTRGLGLAIVAAVAVLAAVYMWQGHPPVDIFFVAVALAVSAIPEGLPVSISVALAIASRRMAANNVIVRNLPAVEGLGACTIIASDKTGTLTVNQLTVKRLWLPGPGALDVEGEGYSALGRVLSDGRPLSADAEMAVRRLAEAGALCNEASWREAGDGTAHHVGDTVDVALLVLAAKLGIDAVTLHRHRPAVAAMPFESHRRYAARFDAEGEAIRASVKGAAESVLPMCRDADREALAARASEMARQGYRVLAVASGRVAGTAATDMHGLEFLGFVGLIDPVRPEVPGAVARCRRAGVQVAMVTGDHPETAFAIGRQLGLAHAHEEVATGAQLAALAGDELRFDEAVARGRIFARVEPGQKLAIVDAMRRAGHFVAVTGDGVNDAPALHAAHIGVAMGRSGTDAARAAGDLILTDDNFTSIVAGIEQGRIAYDNVRKVVLLLISTGAAEIVVFVLAQIAGLPLPMTAVQLLWLNIVTNGIQDKFLAFEAGEPGALNRPPRPPEQPLFDRRLIEATLVSGAAMGTLGFLCFAALLAAGWDEAAARNVLVLLMVTFENVQTFNCRSETRSVFAVPFRANPLLILGVVGAQSIHIAAMFTPGLREVLAIRPVDLATWLAVIGVGAVFLIAIEAYKFFRRRRDRLAYT